VTERIRRDPTFVEDFLTDDGVPETARISEQAASLGRGENEHNKQRPTYFGEPGIMGEAVGRWDERFLVFQSSCE
jgi:hypothetical protein